MGDYVRKFVTGHNVCFETSKRNHEAFEKARQTWIEIGSSLSIKNNSTLLICGAKNNGKSSLVRFLINRYLKDGSDDIPDIDEVSPASKDTRFVYYVDFDPGQPEMATPGTVSAHIIDKNDSELQSPSYMNLFRHKNIAMSSVGGINVSVDPRNYMENCRYVFRSVLEHRAESKEKRPIFINTMGYIRNVGLALLIDLIKITRPTDLVVLNVTGDPMRTIYADLSPKAISNTRASFFYETHEEARLALDYQHHLYNLSFSFVDSATIATKNRIAQQLAYLSRLPEALFKPVMTIEPKLIPIGDISLYCVSSYPLKTEIILELMVHSWVHLIRVRVNSLTRPIQSEVADRASIFKMIDNFGVNQMLGCGIVCSVDIENRTISIITPLSKDELKEVNCIVKPLSIQVPREVFPNY